ncbi:hypothetical protein SRHO_G00310320 [Serrasalmus rhombeus]
MRLLGKDCFSTDLGSGGQTWTVYRRLSCPEAADPPGRDCKEKHFGSFPLQAALTGGDHPNKHTATGQCIVRHGCLFTPVWSPCPFQLGEQAGGSPASGECLLRAVRDVRANANANTASSETKAGQVEDRRQILFHIGSQIGFAVKLGLTLGVSSSEEGRTVRRRQCKERSTASFV